MPLAAGHGVLHHTSHRLEIEQPPLREPRGPRAMAARRAGPIALGDFIPWALLTLAAFLGLGGLQEANVFPDACHNLALSGQVEGGGWYSERSAWPPGVRCVLEGTDGRGVPIDPGVGHVFAAVVCLFLMGVGFVYPPSRSWRRAAQVTVVPSALVGLWIAATAWDVPVGLPAMLLTLALPPALLCWMAAYAWTTWPAGRTFAVLWLGVALSFRLGAFL